MSVFDTEQRYLQLNETACQVMGVDEEALRGRVFPYGVPPDVSQEGLLRALRAVAETGKPVHLERYSRAPSGIRQHAWNMELWPILGENGEVRAVGLAAFDSSDQHWARQRLSLLDEASLSMGRSLDLERTAEEFAALVVPHFADFTSVDLLEDVMCGREPTPGPVGAGYLLRRVAHRSPVRGTPEAVIRLGETDVYPPYSPPARALRTGQPVLSGSGDPAFDQWISSVPARAEKMRGSMVTSMMAFPLIARGCSLGVAVLMRIRPDPFDQDDFTLARELAGRAALCLDNAHRFTRERIAALALQESLLPGGPARQSAVDVACRYLPADARAGAGGDWFDIIPLSGARVALVVGDVVGHGIQASATMGRLRTAVQTLADVDLPPDELLAHLDDVVLRLGEEGARGGKDETGATCLYAVYDPVAGTLTAASAGHPSPVVVLPDGSTRQIEVAVGPVLGVGGFPFEASDTPLPEGTLVALFSDGLVQAPRREPGQGISLLSEILAAAPADAALAECCERTLSALLPRRPADDVALVLARTRVLSGDRVRSWDVPADPAFVAEARRLVGEQLARWGLSEVGFVTELIVSELVTNAIRYGSEPIRLRLIRDRELICEVADESSTSPHLRRARSSDEGGRGLMLVAQFATRWGTRYHATGKTIWAEQALNVDQ
jgi:serine phosphatase RsbU (regulator of sigma subunit)/anti-sigma regulatory factor (Ser/Thr protein kinase)